MNERWRRRGEKVWRWAGGRHFVQRTFTTKGEGLIGVVIGMRWRDEVEGLVEDRRMREEEERRGNTPLAWFLVGFLGVEFGVFAELWRVRERAIEDARDKREGSGWRDRTGVSIAATPCQSPAPATLHPVGLSPYSQRGRFLAPRVAIPSHPTRWSAGVNWLW